MLLAVYIFHICFGFEQTQNIYLCLSSRLFSIYWKIDFDFDQRRILIQNKFKRNKENNSIKCM